MSLSVRITTVCRSYFGTVRNRKLVGNRCDRCPLRTPCMAFGGAPARTFAELDEARAAFELAAERIAGGQP